MSVTLPFRRIGTHLFVEVENELLLIDTGSPDSYSEGKVRHLAPGLRIQHDRSLIVESSELRRATGVPMLGLIGMDILGRCDVVFDLPSGHLTLSLATLPRPERSHDLRPVMGVPVLDLPFHDALASACSTLPVFLDSGAQYSYLPQTRIVSSKIGKVKDYSPILGPINATLYKTLQLCKPTPGRFSVPASFAAPPRGLATLLGLAGVEGILGIDAFDRTVLLSARERWVSRV